jgi:hypothetical protein
MLHFKSSNGSAPNNTGYNGAAFYGDLLLYSFGPDRTIRARATQNDNQGTDYFISLYLPGFTGDALIEIVGAYGVNSQSFNFNPIYGQTWGNDNYIEGTVDLIYTSNNPPALSDITGASTLFQNNGGSYVISPSALQQSISSITSAGNSNILSSPATPSETAIYVVTTKGKTYPIEQSSTISIRQDIDNTGFIYLDLKSSALSNYAPLNNPTFTGTVNTGPLNVITSQSWGTLQLSPPQDNLEVGVGFYRYADKRVSNPGDAWLIGQQLCAVTGSFVIGTGNVGPCLSINASGNVNINNSLTVNGTNVISNFLILLPIRILIIPFQI